jgi:putative oxidoreductase
MEKLSRYGTLAGRFLIAVLFLHESWFKITHLGLTIAYMAQYRLPAILLPVALFVELFDWTDANQLLHFEKDFALAGALLIIASHEWASVKNPTPARVYET